jgi:hypothetical protein
MIDMRALMKLVEAVTDDVPQQYVTAAKHALDAADLPVTVHLTPNPSRYHSDYPLVELSYIDVPHELRGQGIGNKAMTLLTGLADRMGVALCLTITDYEDEEDEATLAGADLDGWYWKHGFEGNGHWMIREPKQKS